jgi:hypothetical protein
MPTVIDAGDLARFRYYVYVDHNGVLKYHTSSLVSEIQGIGEWDRDLKRQHQISPDKTVLDLFIKPLSHVENE